MVSLIPPLIDAATSLFTGFFGGDSKQTVRTKEKTKAKSATATATTTKANLGQMVRQAEKYGFNPLTVLRAGGLGAYASSTSASTSKTKSNSKGKNVTSSSSSAPLAQGIASAVNAVGNALTSTASTPAATSSAAWNEGAGAPGLSEYDLVMRQLAGSNWDAGQAVLNPVAVPASAERYAEVAPLTGVPIPTSREGREYGTNNVMYDSKGNPIMPDDGKIGPVDAKLDSATFMQFLPKWAVKEYGLTLDTDRFFNVDAAAWFAGDDQGQLPMVAWNAAEAVRQNMDKIPRMAVDAMRSGAEYHKYVPGMSGINTLMEWDPPAFQSVDNPEGAIATMATDRQKVVFGDPALMSPTAYRQMMEQYTQSSY